MENNYPISDGIGHKRKQIGVSKVFSRPKFLSQYELRKGRQVYTHRDQLMKAKPIGISRGRDIMNKIGWSDGEGLGKGSIGRLEPISTVLLKKPALGYIKGPPVPIKELNLSLIHI